jgi:hypothetical protein
VKVGNEVSEGMKVGLGRKEDRKEGQEIGRKKEKK